MEQHLSENIYTVKLGSVTLMGRIFFTTYHDGSPAIQIIDPDGPETLSVNMAGYGVVSPGYPIVYVKNYSEHEGLPDALVAAGIAEKINEVRMGPFDSSFWLMKVTAQ